MSHLGAADDQPVHQETPGLFKVEEYPKIPLAYHSPPGNVPPPLESLHSSYMPIALLQLPEARAQEPPVARRRYTGCRATGKQDKLGNSTAQTDSLLSSLSKLLERVVDGRVLAHIPSHRLLRDEQFGFRFTKSFEYNLTVIAVLDIEKAFDRVYHPGLLYKRHVYNFLPYFFRLISSNLISRKFHFSLDGEDSIACQVTNSRTSPMNIDRAIRLVQAALDDIEPWLTKWRTKPHAAKMEALKGDSSTERGHPATKLQFCGQQLQYSDMVKYLVVIMDRNLIHLQYTSGQLLVS
ncbi:hypothetical protein PR048_001955 [Dryococelus australis]|uniref:Reverse transcriptase domain-containing protein n=1 Tax=Dryococelus australis TaxID=614101 RepID=A0ABQ9IIW6_9NEOP|nr:hypothetical protein PR048_001955 [Dryococelus australis]